MFFSFSFRCLLSFWFHFLFVSLLGVVSSCSFLSQINARKIHGELNVFDGILINRYFLAIMGMELLMQVALVPLPLSLRLRLPLSLPLPLSCLPLTSLSLFLSLSLSASPSHSLYASSAHPGLRASTAHALRLSLAAGP